MADETEWVLIGLEQTIARRQGLPVQLPIPKKEFESLAEKGLNADTARKWVKDFLTSSEAGKSGVWRKKNSQLVSSLEGFVDKAPLLERAQKAFQENDHEKAISTLKRIATMDPDDHSTKLNLGAAQANAGDHAGALKSFSAVKATYKGDPDYHVSVAHLHLAMTNRDAAIEQFVLALEAKPDHQAALEALAKLGVLVAVYENPRDAASLTYVRSDAVLEWIAGVWDAEPRDATYYLEQLAYHERERRHAIVLSAAERAASAGGDARVTERAEAARVAALRAVGRVDDAAAAARAYLEKNPGSAGVRVELSRTLAAKGAADEARREIDEALRADPGDQMALMLRFWPDDQNDIAGIQAALPSLQEFASTHSAAAGVWRSVGRAMLAIGRPDDAMELFGKAVGLAPDDDDLRAEYWAELGKLERYADILKDAGAIADMAKRDWKLRWNEAEAFLGLGKRIEARAAFSAINFDETLHVDVRKRAKRAVKTMDEGPQAG